MRYDTAWREAIDQFVWELRSQGMSIDTIRTRRSWVRIFARTSPALADVTRRDVVRWLATDRWKPATRKSARQSLIGFFAWAHAEGHVAVNPAIRLRSVPVRQPLPRPTAEPVYRGAVAATRDSDRLMLLLAGGAGLRRAEIAALRREDLTDRGLYVRGKGGRERFIPLSAGAELRRLLESRPGGWVFPGRWTGHLHEATVGKRIRRLLHEQSSAHRLRHRFGTVAYDAVRDIRVVQDLLGHASPATSAVYIAISDAIKRQAVDAAA